jgi:hypothetical protein
VSRQLSSPTTKYFDSTIDEAEIILLIVRPKNNHQAQIFLDNTLSYPNYMFRLIFHKAVIKYNQQSY